MLTTFITSDKFLILGCPTCESNKGQLRLYDLPTLKIGKFYIGDANYGYIGKSVALKDNVDNSQQIWYSSRKGSTLTFNSIIFFEDYETEIWKFHQTKDLYYIVGTSNTDTLVFDCYGEWCFFKSYLGSTISTFTSCNYNERYISEFELAGRTCGRCIIGKPFSYGFASDDCKACSEFEGNVANLPEVE